MVIRRKSMMKFKSVRIWVILTLVIVLIIAASSCSLPVPDSSTPEPAGELTPDAVYTAAVLTVIAQLTESAPTPVPTQTQPPPEATLPAEDTPAPTIQESPTALPSASPTSTPTSLPAPTSTVSAEDPKSGLSSPAWQDTFENGDSWALLSDEHSSIDVKDNQMVMVSYNADFWNSWALTPHDLEVFYLEAQGSSGACSGRDRWGLLFRAPNFYQGYLFGVSCDGRYALWTWDGSHEEYLIEWTDSEHILAGADKTNRIGVKADGNRLSLYANGKFLDEVRDDSYAAGRFGLFVGAAETPGFTAKVDEIAYWLNP
jgi:hypothetical protein